GGGLFGGGLLGGGLFGGVPPLPMWTTSSNKEYPNCVARVVPNIRRYRPVPVTFRVCVPPVPVVVEKMLVHVDASAETWIWNPVANAASQVRTTWHTAIDEPRSTCNHCGSLNALDHRVPVFPSTAFDAGKDAFSVDDAVAGRPCAAFAVPQPPPVTSEPN